MAHKFCSVLALGTVGLLAIGCGDQAGESVTGTGEALVGTNGFAANGLDRKSVV